MKPPPPDARPPTPAPEFFSPDVSAARRFYLDLKPPARARWVVVCGGREHCTPTYEIHRLTFPFYSLEYVVEGRGTVRLGGRPHALQPGTVFAYGPGIRQDITGNPASPLVKYFVDFAGTQALAWLRTGRLAPGRVARVHPPHALQSLFDELIEGGLRGTPQSAPLGARLLECVLLRLAETRAPREGTESLAFATYEQCRHHIQQHFRRLRSLAQIAGECHLDAAYLCRLFRRFSPHSPYQYLLRLRLNLAADLLQQPGAMVKRVASAAGFSDPFHFSRAFKAQFGLAPDSFRRLRTAAHRSRRA